MTEYRIRYYWYGTTYFDYLAELPPYAKLTEIPMRTVEEIPSTERHTNNITESKGGNVPQLAERPPNTDNNADRRRLRSPLMQLVTSQKV